MRALGFTGLIIGVTGNVLAADTQVSTHPLNPFYRHTLSTHSIDTPSQHIISTHHNNTSCQHITTTHLVNLYCLKKLHCTTSTPVACNVHLKLLSPIPKNIPSHYQSHSLTFVFSISKVAAPIMF